MSLINQMLRDLESRRVTPAAAGGGVVSLALAAERAVDAGALAGDSGQTNGARRWLLMVIVLGLPGLLLWLSQTPWQERVVPVDAASVVPMLSVPVVEMAVEPVSDTPAGPVVAAPSPATGEKMAVEAPFRSAPVESAPPRSILRPEPLHSTTSVQAPAVDTGVIKRIRPLNNEQRAEQALRRGVDLLERGRQVEAELALHEALQFDARQLRARETLAALYFNRGRLNEAQALLADGVRLSPHAAGLAQRYARLLAEQGDLTMALTVLQRVSPSLAENLDFYALWAALYQRAGRHEAAVRTYHQLLAQRGTQATWWMGLGISLEALGEIAPALAAYGRAYQLGADLNSQVLAYLGSRIRVLAARPTVVEKGE